MLSYRIFEDEAGRMNRSLTDIGGGLLAGAAIHAGRRHSQGHARRLQQRGSSPTVARALFDELLALARARHAEVATGEFGAHMQVALVNDGPVTFWLEAALGMTKT